jgi:ribosomal protein L44E
MSILPKIEVPHYTMVVPSTNEKVTYRPYLVKEEKVLMIALESSDPEQISSAMEHIIEVCVDTDTSALTSYDVEYLFLKLRSVSVGAKIEMYRGCDECDFKKNLVIVDLDKIEVRNKKEQEELRIELTDNVIVDINYPKTSANIDRDVPAAELLINVVAHCIDTLHYGEETFSSKDIGIDEMQEFVENLNTQQFNKITKVLLNVPYVGLDLKYKCTECGHEHNLELKGLIDFFM